MARPKESIRITIIPTRINRLVHEKITAIILAQKPEQGGKQEIIEEIHQGDNAAMHQRSMTEILLQFTPVLTEAVEQGIRQKVFSTPYPRETIKFLLASALLLVDDELFSWDGETMLQKATAFIYTMETIMGAEKGSFAFAIKYFDQLK